MRPSELKAAKTPAIADDGKKKYASSPRADPSITEAEAQAATSRFAAGMTASSESGVPRNGQCSFVRQGSSTGGI